MKLKIIGDVIFMVSSMLAILIAVAMLIISMIDWSSAGSILLGVCMFMTVVGVMLFLIGERYE